MLRLFWVDLVGAVVEIRDMKWFSDRGTHDINYIWQGNQVNLGLIIKDDDKVIYSRQASLEPRGYSDPEGEYMAQIKAEETDEQLFFDNIHNELKYRKSYQIKRIVLNYKYFPEYCRKFKDNIESGNLIFQSHPVVIDFGELLENNEVFKIEMDEGLYLKMGQKR